MTFDIKDSGSRQEFDGGAVRDTEEGKLDYSNLFVWFEPMGTRYVAHMTKGRKKYPDPAPGIPNWSLFEATPETLARTLRSFDRHVKQYRMGETDEDHAAAILFNLNLAEKIREELEGETDGYHNLAEEMLDDPTFDAPVDEADYEYEEEDLTPPMTAKEIGKELRVVDFEPGDRVRVADRRLISRYGQVNAYVIKYDHFPEVVTLKRLTYPNGIRAWYIEEMTGFIFEGQLGGLAKTRPASHTDPGQYIVPEGGISVAGVDVIDGKKRYILNGEEVSEAEFEEFFGL